MTIGTPVIDRRNGREVTFNGWSKCGKFAVVKAKGKAAHVVPREAVRRITWKVK